MYPTLNPGGGELVRVWAKRVSLGGSSNCEGGYQRVECMITGRVIVWRGKARKEKDSVVIIDAINRRHNPREEEKGGTDEQLALTIVELPMDGFAGPGEEKLSQKPKWLKPSRGSHNITQTKFVDQLAVVATSFNNDVTNRRHESSESQCASHE